MFPLLSKIESISNSILPLGLKLWLFLHFFPKVLYQLVNQLKFYQILNQLHSGQQEYILFFIGFIFDLLLIIRTLDVSSSDSLISLALARVFSSFAICISSIPWAFRSVILSIFTKVSFISCFSNSLRSLWTFYVFSLFKSERSFLILLRYNKILYS